MLRPTLQPLHPIQLGEQLVDHTVGYSCAVVASPWRQRVKLIEEQDARFGSLCPETETGGKKTGGNIYNH